MKIEHFKDQRRIIVIRHAKAVEGNGGLKDFDRPLTDRGLKDAHNLGAAIASGKIEDAMMISSPATRAIKTAEIVAKKIGLDNDRIFQEKRLYNADCDSIFEIIAGIDDRVRCLLIVGHNPGLHDFVNSLSDKIINKFPTASAAVIEVESESWSHFRKHSGRLIEFIHP